VIVEFVKIVKIVVMVEMVMIVPMKFAALILRIFHGINLVQLDLLKRPVSLSALLNFCASIL
jgi:hypothetical protein